MTGEEKAYGYAGRCADCHARAYAPYRCADSGTDREPDTERQEPQVVGEYVTFGFLASRLPIQFIHDPPLDHFHSSIPRAS